LAFGLPQALLRQLPQWRLQWRRHGEEDRGHSNPPFRAWPARAKPEPAVLAARAVTVTKLRFCNPAALAHGEQLGRYPARRPPRAYLVLLAFGVISITQISRASTSRSDIRAPNGLDILSLNHPVASTGPNSEFNLLNANLAVPPAANLFSSQQLRAALTGQMETTLKTLITAFAFVGRRGRPMTGRAGPRARYTGSQQLVASPYIDWAGSLLSPGRPTRRKSTIVDQV
jgi:hypothetical protein